jgi:hypothetical protein
LCSVEKNRNKSNDEISRETHLVLWKFGLFPAEFTNGSRQSPALFGWVNPLISEEAAILTNRLISIAYTEISRNDVVS